MPKTGCIAKESGLFRCARCGKEISVRQRQTFPPCANCKGSEWSAQRITRAARGRKKPKGFWDSLFS